MQSNKEIKKKFIEYFLKNEHKIYKYSNLIPENDDSILFVNSGMVQFKKYFLELEKPKDKNIITIQKCIRIDGKHNDLNEIGLSLNHHTFFEMMGNFSFGGYNKEEACYLAWKFLTKEININKEKLFITYFKGDENIEEDKETFNIWKKIGIKEDNIKALGKKDNFWIMGDKGPCGPCTEIHYLEEENNLLEVWNIVFMQYEKNEDGIKKKKKTFIDTGMGLERLCRIIQGKKNNYETDIFDNYFKIFNNLGIEYLNSKENLKDICIRTIIDHLRSVVFLIAENIIPENEKRGYILKKIIRRIILNNLKINNFEINEKIIKEIIFLMKEDYAEINHKEKKTLKIINKEKKIFLELLNNSEKIINKYLKRKEKKELNKKDIEFLYETHGVPFEAIKSVCKKNTISFEEVEINKKIIKDKQIKIIEKNKKEYTSNFKNKKKIISKIIKIIKLKKKNRVAVVLEKTIFHSESGGQISDLGRIKGFFFLGKIKNVKEYKNSTLHYIKIIKGKLKINDEIKCYINKKIRFLISCNHSATHILAGYLRNITKNNNLQKGSLITDKFLRFDFINNGKINKNNIKKLEKKIKITINKKTTIIKKKKELTKINKKKIIKNDLEKYPKIVNIIKINNFLELCCGTHVKNTRKIKNFRIIEFSNISKNISRIKAITNKQIIIEDHKNEKIINNLIKITKKNKKELIKLIENLIKNNQEKDKELKNAISKLEIKNIILKIKENTYEDVIYQTNNKEILKKYLIYFEVCRILTNKKIIIIYKDNQELANIIINLKTKKEFKKTNFIINKKNLFLFSYKLIKMEKNNTLQILLQKNKEKIKELLYYIKL